jgi:hypothetical protein
MGTAELVDRVVKIKAVEVAGDSWQTATLAAIKKAGRLAAT